MKAMILAAGRGERMRPLTDDLPKPLLRAGGSALIAFHLRRLARAGIRDVVVNHAWLGDKIEAALGDGAAFGVRIRYSAEEVALETAGGVARALPLLGASPFLLVNGDTFCDFDYGRVLTVALQMRYAGLSCWCVMVPNPRHHERGDFRLSGGVLGTTTADDALAGVQPVARRAPPTLTYAGIGIYEPRVFDAIPRGEKSPLRPWLEREIAAGRAAGEYHGGLWFDIGTPQRLAELDKLLTTGSITVGV